MPRTPADQTIHDNDQRIYGACARLERCVSAARALRFHVEGVLPLASAELHMNDIGTHLDAIDAKLTGALAEITQEIDRRHEADPDRYFAANDNVVTLVTA